MPKSKVLNKHVLAALVPGARVNNTTFEIAVDTDADAPTVIFNVGGVIFETYRSTLCRHTDTNVSDENFLEKFYRQTQNDYFFDHDPVCFSAVLDYLRTGELHLPPNVCGPALKKELDFWGVSEHLIQSCCWNNYDSWNSTYESLQQLERDRKKIFIDYEPADSDELTMWERFCRKTWSLLTNQASSFGAKVYDVIAVLFVILSILTFILETHPTFRVSGKRDWLGRLYRRSMNHTDSNEFWIPHPALVVIDLICLIVFSIELIARFISAPSRRRFFFNFFNVIDLICLLPEYIEIIVFSLMSNHVDSIIQYINFLRIMRVFRVFRLVRHVSGLWIMLYTLKASMRDLFLMCVFMMMGMLFFASLIHYVEEKKFPNIPISLWWALITMTTVGYGDMFPEENLGYLVGSVCAMTGLLVVGFTVPIIVNHFVLYYTHIQSAIRADKREKKNAKEDKNLENLIAEERRESVLLDMKQRMELSEQLSNGKVTDHPRVCNGNIDSPAERKRKENIFHTTIQQEAIRMEMLLPPNYSSVTNLHGEVSKSFAKNKRFLSAPGRGHAQMRRKSLPCLAINSLRHTCNGTMSPVQKRKTRLDATMNGNCGNKLKTSSEHEHKIKIKIEDVPLGDTGTTYL